MSELAPWRPALAPAGPSAPPTSRNPATGLPEFSLEANRRAATGDMAQQIAGQMLNGSLSDHKALGDWINQNKRQLRVQFGGQGIQNIMQVGSLVRRAANEEKPSTVLSALMKGAAPDLMAKIGDPAALVALAIGQPQLTKILATSSKGAVNKIGQNRLNALLSAPDGNGPSSGIGARANEPTAANASGGNRIFASATSGPNLEGGIGANNAPGQIAQVPPQVANQRVAV